MKKKTVMLACAAVMMMSSACAPVGSTTQPTASPAQYRKISAEQAHEMMQDEPSFILLDVRTQDEYDQLRIQGARLIPYNEIAQRASEELEDKDQVILIYCRTGRRSATAAKVLAAMGYTQVYDFGGIYDWPYETTED